MKPPVESLVARFLGQFLLLPSSLPSLGVSFVITVIGVLLDILFMLCSLKNLRDTLAVINQAAPGSMFVQLSCVGMCNVMDWPHTQVICRGNDDWYEARIGLASYPGYL